MEQEKKEMTEEEMKARYEARKKEWEDFVEKLKATPDNPVTNADLVFLIEVMTENLSGMGEMAGVAIHNTQALAHNFDQLMSMIGLKPNAGAGNRTKGGIILPR